MIDTKNLKIAVQRYWDEQPCGVKSSAAQPGTPLFYEQVESYRYDEEFHIPMVAEFTDHCGETVLEIGCGLGTDGRQFALGGAHYFGCDLSLDSLQLARRGFEHYELKGSFVNTDATQLPFSDNSIDTVYSHGVLHHVPDTEATLSEVHRILRPGGKAIVMLYARESFGYIIGAQIFGRIRLAMARSKMGPEAFNTFIGLPPDHRSWIPNWAVINNSTDGVGNPLSKMYTAEQLRHMFTAFQRVHLEKHYFPRRKIPVIGPRFPQSIAYWLGRIIGSFWYIKAEKC